MARTNCFHLIPAEKKQIEPTLSILKANYPEYELRRGLIPISNARCFFENHDIDLTDEAKVQNLIQEIENDNWWGKILHLRDI